MASIGLCLCFVVCFLFFLFFFFISIFFFLFSFFFFYFFFFSSRRRHTRYIGDWSSDVCSSDLYSGRAHGSGGGPRMGVGDPGTRAGASRGHQHRSDRGVRVQGSHIRDVASERATACRSDCARQGARGGATPTGRTCGDSVAAAAASGSRLDAAEQQGQGAADGRNPASAGVACGRWRQEHRAGGGAARRRTTERLTATQRVGARGRRSTPGTLRPRSDPDAGRRLPGRGLSGAAPVAGTVV